MTLDAFVAQCGKKKETVVGWLNNRYIPGAHITESTGEWYIPDDARPPYMKKKPKNGGDAMFRSIANAVADGYAVCPELYGLSTQRFETYTNQLVQAGIITSYVAEGVTYFEPTLETRKFAKLSNKMALEIIKQVIEAGSKGTAQGVTEGVLSAASA